MRTLVSLCLGCALLGASAEAAPYVRQREEIEWTDIRSYNTNDTKLPRVLLVGDSIVGGYQDFVMRKLQGTANVTYLATSKCVTDPSYLRLLAFQLAEQHYDVIHFNNGLHSLSTDRAAWVKSLKAAFALLKKDGKGAKIIWATSTPLSDAGLNAKVVELNSLAAPIVKAEGFAVDDLYSFLDPFDRKTCWVDTFHHTDPTRDKTADQVAASCRAALGAK